MAETPTTIETYQPDPPADHRDLMIAAGSGPEPRFDPIMQALLLENYNELKQRCAVSNGLLSFASLGLNLPWLYRLTFDTRGFAREADGEVVSIDRHVVALRFLPDYLRDPNRFAMLRLVEPANLFHPNIRDGGICLQIHDGGSLIQIAQSLHDLFRWRLRQYDERDAMNPAACAWGRANIDQPIDDRPLFGKRVKLTWEAAT